jgi:hypothetical protein
MNICEGQWFTGALTPRAMQEISTRGMIVKERAGEILMPAAAQ